MHTRINWAHLDRLLAGQYPVTIADTRQKDCPIVFANAAFCALTGYSLDFTVGRNCRFLQGDNNESATRARIRKLIRSQGSGEFLLKNQRKDGSLFYNYLMLGHIKHSDGLIMGLQRELDTYSFPDILSKVELSESEPLLGLLDGAELSLLEYMDTLRASSDALRTLVEASMLMSKLLQPKSKT